MPTTEDLVRTKVMTNALESDFIDEFIKNVDVHVTQDEHTGRYFAHCCNKKLVASAKTEQEAIAKLAIEYNASKTVDKAFNKLKDIAQVKA